MGLDTIYTIGIPVALVMALIWSFILDKQKPPTIKEFIAKFLARALVLIILFSVVVGVLTMALVAPPKS